LYTIAFSWNQLRVKFIFYDDGFNDVRNTYVSLLLPTLLQK